MSKLFFTSDTHYGHKNIIRFPNRPFSSVEEMDEAMIERWNAKVGVGDVVYHLGDFSFHNREKTKEIVSRLKGEIAFLWGNHDRVMNQVHADHLIKLGHYTEVNRWEQKMVLCHYPMLSWNKGHHGSWMLHGHCHGSLNYMNNDTKRLDVGVDNFNFEPVSFEEVKAIMDGRTFKNVDHHTTEGRRM